MAKVKSQGSKPQVKSQNAPEGFNIKAQRSRGDGWVKKESGNTITGRLKGMFEFEGDNGPRRVYQIELADSCTCMVGVGDETEEQILEAGALVNADGAALDELEKYTSNGGVYDVWFQYTEKRKVGRGNMWDGDGPFLKEIKAPTAERAAAQRAAQAGKSVGDRRRNGDGKGRQETAGDDDVPF